MTKFLVLIIGTFLLMGCNRQNSEIGSVTYNIILSEKNPTPMSERDSFLIPGKINTLLVKNLNEPLKSLTALYSAQIGSYCDHGYCDLTTALGLGKQGSEKQKRLIDKYFQGDKLAEFLINQECALGQDGSSFYTDFIYLNYILIGDTVKVNYSYAYFSPEDEGVVEKTDIYLYQDNCFEKLQRDDKWINCCD